MKKRLLFSLLLLAFAFPAFAAQSLFMKPYVSEMHLSGFSGSDHEKAREALEKGVELQTAFYEKWTTFFNAFTAKRQQMITAADSGNWEQFKTLLSENTKAVEELEALAKEYPQLSDSQNFESLIRQDFTYLAQNAGLQPSGDFQATVLKALETETTRDKASTFAAGFFSQAYQRGFSIAENAGKIIGENPLKEFRASLQEQRTQQAARDTGSTKEGYFSGFLDRIKFAGTGIIFYIVLAVLFGLWMGGRTRIANLWSVALFNALLVSIPLVLIYSILPFIPGVAFIAAFFILFLALWSLSNERIERIFPPFIARLLKKGTPPPVQTMATHGSASWGSANNAAEHGHLAPKEPAFALGRLADTMPGQDNRFRFMGHVVTCAPTGSGKGIGAVVPNLLEYPGSALVLDLKGENYAVTARQRRGMGQTVFCVDPFNVTGSGGNSFNPLDRVDLNSPDCVGEATAIAESLVMRAGGGESAFFDDSAQNYLQALVLYVKTLAPELQNLREVRRLVNLEGKDFDKLIVDMIVCDDAGYGVISRMGQAMKGKPEKERGSVLSTAQQHTAFLDDPRIADVLSSSDFDLGQLVTELATVYLVIPPNRLGNNARFMRLFIGAALAALTSAAKPPRLRVAFFLDEFAQLGYMRQVEDAISILRGYRGLFWLFLQDMSQLKAVYEKWQSFLANAGKVFYGTADFDTAKYVSESLGQRTIDYTTVGHSTGDRSSSTSQSQQITGRELLTPDEVMRLGPERPIVLISGEYPYMLHRLNYLVDPEYQGLYDANPYHS